MLILLLAAQTSVAGIPAITVRKTDEGYRAEAAAFQVFQEAAVHAEIARRAADLCAGKDIDWGKFGSLAKLEKNPSSQPPTISGYFQEFRCVAAEKLAYAAVPGDWKPSAADEADVRRVFETYYVRRDAGQFESAAAMFEPGVQDTPSAEDQREFNRKLGRGSRRITGVTWYVNRPDAPRPGVYVALDFMGDYPQLHVYCGYLMLYRQGPGRYAITREEQNIFERGDGKADMAQVAAMRSAVCRGN